MCEISCPNRREMKRDLDRYALIYLAFLCHMPETTVQAVAGAISCNKKLSSSEDGDEDNNEIEVARTMCSEEYYI